MRKVLSLPLLLLFLTSCGSDTMSLFFDIPAKSEEQVLREAQLKAIKKGTNRSQTSDTQAAAGHPSESSERPPIEKIFDWQEARELLPKDAMGGVDWVAAVEQGLIKPRAGDDLSRHGATSFKLDFYIPGPDPLYDAFFPHSVHTQFLGCQNCHPVIFKYKDNALNMGEVFAGQSCGTCHGKVAFGVEQCARCHQAMG